MTCLGVISAVATICCLCRCTLWQIDLWVSMRCVSNEEGTNCSHFTYHTARWPGGAHGPNGLRCRRKHVAITGMAIQVVIPDITTPAQAMVNDMAIQVVMFDITTCPLFPVCSSQAIPTQNHIDQHVPNSFNYLDRRASKVSMYVCMQPYLGDVCMYACNRISRQSWIFGRFARGGGRTL